MKKRIISVLLAMVMVFSTLPISALAETVSGESQDTIVTAQQSDTTGNLNGAKLGDQEEEKITKAYIQGGLALIPYVGPFASLFSAPFLDMIFGLDSSDTLEKLIEAIEDLRNEILQLQVQLDASTQEILGQLYETQEIGTFQEDLNKVHTTIKNLYLQIETYMRQENVSEEYRTLAVAELLQTSDFSSDGFINQLDFVMSFLDGSYQSFSNEGSVLKSIYNCECMKSKLGGEAGLLAADYLNNATNIVLDGYAALFTVLQAKQYVHEHLDELEEKAETDVNLKRLLTTEAISHYTAPFTMKIDEEDEKYAAFFLTAEECKARAEEREAANNKLTDTQRAQLNMKNPLFESEDEEPEPKERNTYSIEKYNHFIDENWFSYIRTARVNGNKMDVELVPLAKELGILKSSDNGLGIDWSLKEDDIENMVKNVDYNVRRKFFHALEIRQTEQDIKINEIADLILHIRANANNVFLPEDEEKADNLYYVDCTVRDLLEVYGFVVPPNSGPEDIYIGSDTACFYNNPYGHHYEGTLDIWGLPDTETYRYDKDSGKLISKSVADWTGVRCYEYLNEEVCDKNSAFYYFLYGKAIEINTTEDFERFIASIADGEDYLYKTVELTADIDLEGEDYTKIWPAEAYNNTFRGTFDGKGYTIKGLNDVTTNSRGGIFRSLGDGAVIKDLTIENPIVNATNGGAGALAGGVLGYSTTISNVHVIGGSVTTTNYAAGGIASTCDNAPTITECSNSAMIKATSSCAGGIVGKVGNRDWNPCCIMSKCKNYGNVSGDEDTGGIVGALSTDNWSHDFSECTNKGDITSTLKAAGGIVAGSTGGGNFTKCENTGKISGHTFAAGIVAWNENDAIDFSGSINGEEGDPTIGEITANESIAGGIAGYLGHQEVENVRYIGNNCKNYANVTGKSCTGGIVGNVDNNNRWHDFSGCINRGTITSYADVGGGIIGAALGYGSLNYGENYGKIYGRNVNIRSQAIGWMQQADNWTTTGFVFGSIDVNVSLDKDNLKYVANEKGNNALEHKMELLNVYENLKEEERRKMSSDRESMQLISALIKQVEDQNHQYKLNDHSVLLLGTGENGTDNPNWRLILTANKLETIPDAINAKIAKGWKVLAADNIAVTRYGGGDIEGEFTIGFSGKGIERYKNAQAVVYHLLADGTVEELKPTWNEEQKCFTVVTDSFSPFVLAVDVNPVTPYIPSPVTPVTPENPTPDTPDEPEVKPLVVSTTAIKGLTAYKKAFKVTWTAKKNAAGYEIQYSTNKNFKNAKKVVVTNAKAKSKKITKLKAKKKYFVRIRCYNKNENGTKRSKWSAVKSIKTK